MLAVISSVFFAMDFDLITDFLRDLLPERWRGLTGELRTFSTNILGSTSSPTL